MAKDALHQTKHRSWLAFATFATPFTRALKNSSIGAAGRVDKFQQRMVKTQAAQAANAAKKKKK